MEVQTVSEKSKGYVWILLGVPVLFALLALQNAQAAPVISIGALEYAGTGCVPSGESVVDVSKRIKTLSFSHYDAGKGAVSGLVRSSCNIATSVTVPDGYQVALSASFKGYIKGDGRLVRMYGSSANPRGASFTSELASVRGKRYSQVDNVSTQWSACGAGSRILRLNSSIQAVGSGSHVSVDKMTVRLNVRPCR